MVGRKIAPEWEWEWRDIRGQPASVGTDCGGAEEAG